MFRDPISELSAHLRHTSGAEFIEEWETTELETEQGRLRARGLVDVWLQAMHRGDRVTVTGAFGSCTGSVDYVGNDYAVVAAEGDVWDLRLDRCVVGVHRAVQGGHTVRGGSRTFRARLAEYEATGELVTLHTPERAITGRIEVAATDHIMMSGDVVVPTATIHAISRRQE